MLLQETLVVDTVSRGCLPFR